MNVLVLDNSIATTGAFLSALAMADALRDQVEFTFVLPASSSCHATVSAAGYASLPLPMVEIGRSVNRMLAYFPMLLLNGWRLRRILARHDIDVLVANDYFNQLPLMVRLMGWRRPTVTIVRLLPDSQVRLLNRLWLASMRVAATARIAVSRAVLAQLPSTLDAHLVYFPVGRGIDEARYVPPPSHSGCRFLYLANYIRGKGQEQALEAFALVHAQVPDATLDFVGGDMGLDKNRQYRAELASQAARLGITDRVTFSDSTTDVPATIRAADVVLNFSRAESFSQTCAEAGHLGRPVVATCCGGPEEIIVDGETGYLVAVDDINGAANAMLRLASDSDLRLAFGQQAHLVTGRSFGVLKFREAMLPLMTTV